MFNVISINYEIDIICTSHGFIFGVRNCTLNLIRLILKAQFLKTRVRGETFVPQLARKFRMFKIRSSGAP